MNITRQDCKYILLRQKWFFHHILYLSDVITLSWRRNNPSLKSALKQIILYIEKVKIKENCTFIQQEQETWAHAWVGIFFYLKWPVKLKKIK